MALLLLACFSMIFGTWIMAFGLLKLRALGDDPFPYLIIGISGSLIAILMSSAYSA